MPAPTKPYSVIYNWDGAPHGYDPPPQTVEQLLDSTFRPLAGTQCGALFYSTGGHTAQYPSDVLPLVRDKAGRDAYESVGAMIGGENIRQQIDRGDDWQPAMIAHGAC
eukprot:SAG22_NODE_7_length_40155_cov_25.241356_19_plen_108_part_00